MKIRVYNNNSIEVLKLEYFKDGDWDCDYDMTFFQLENYSDSITLIKSDSGEAIFSMRKGDKGIYVELLEYGYTIEIY